MGPRRMERLNISAIYPEETLARLERVFYGMMGETFERGRAYPLTTLSTYEERIGYYGEGYWVRFEEEALRTTESLQLLSEFSRDPYGRAYEAIQRDREGERVEHVRNLGEHRARREEAIKTIVIELVEETLRTITTIIPFDFRHYNDVYDRVIGDQIRTFTPDPLEQEIMRARTTEYMASMDSLKAMFFKVMEEHFNEGLRREVITLGEIDRKGEEYASPDFWDGFRGSLEAVNPSLLSLKDFFRAPYRKILEGFREGNESVKQQQIMQLGIQRKERLDYLEREAYRLTGETIERFVPRQTSGQALMFDFAYHKDVYDEVTGRLIGIVTIDSIEQELMRRSTADYISRHSEKKMQEYMNARLRRIEEQLGLEAPVLDSRGSVMPLPAWVSSVSEIRAPLRAYPPIAIGHEDDYDRFLSGILTYKPNSDDTGRVDIPIRSLANPLEGRFDLSAFGDTSRYISIHTGYKKAKIPANADKVEIWLTPKFLVEANLGGDAAWMSGVMSGWEAPYGIVWTWGNNEVRYNFDYLLKGEVLLDKDKNLSEKARHSYPPYTQDSCYYRAAPIALRFHYFIFLDFN